MPRAAGPAPPAVHASEEFAMRPCRPRPVAIAVAIAGITASLLTGCFGNPGDLVDKGVEDAIESATGGDVSLGGELPADFPTTVRSSTATSDVRRRRGRRRRRAGSSSSRRLPPIRWRCRGCARGRGLHRGHHLTGGDGGRRASTRTASTSCSSPARATASRTRSRRAAAVTTSARAVAHWRGSASYALAGADRRASTAPSRRSAIGSG